MIKVVLKLLSGLYVVWKALEAGVVNTAREPVSCINRAVELMEPMESVVLILSWSKSLPFQNGLTKPG